MPNGATVARRRPRRPFAAAALLLLVAVVVAGAAAPDVAALSIRRTWRATLSGGHGSAMLVSYTNGTGFLRIAGSGFAPSTSLGVVVYTGTCTSPRVVVRFRPVTTDASGAVASQMGIDLPIIKRPSGFPRCNVAMYWPEASQPREAGVTFIYGHARTGMFLPLLPPSRIKNGASLVGMTVRVWTSDSVLSTYRIVPVRRHQRTFGNMLGITREELWIQTSEGPRGTPDKLILVAKRISSVASSYASAHPTPHPIVCR
jgi:hypothetical protein